MIVQETEQRREEDGLKVDVRTVGEGEKYENDRENEKEKTDKERKSEEL